jgi:hypothetical protein
MNTHRLFNINNKFSSDVFIHITKAPDSALLESNFPIRVLVEEISTAAAPAGLETPVEATKAIPPFEADIIDMARYYLSELGSLVTYPSHGVNLKIFIENYLKDHPGGHNDQLAVFIYRRVK